MADEASTVVRSFEALMDADDVEVANGFLLAGVYAVAIQTGELPTDVVEALFKSVPSSETWPALRASLVHALEERDRE